MAVSSPPLVSAITIFRDCEKYLGEAIESVMAQTYAHWELLLVDDGSSDGGTRIARRYAEQHPGRIRYLDHPGHAHRGMSASRNLGIAHANGVFVAFLDGDDVWLPAKLHEQLAVFASHPRAGMVYGRTLIWCSWTDDPRVARPDYTIDLGVPSDSLVEPPGLVALLLRNKAQTPTTCNAIIRREVLDAVGRFEEEFRGLYEDQVFFAKVHLRVPVYVAEACWAKYRQHPESCSAMAEGADYHESRRPFLDWLARYIAGQGIPPDSPIWATLRDELRMAHPPRLRRLYHLVRRATARFTGRLRG